MMYLKRFVVLAGLFLAMAEGVNAQVAVTTYYPNSTSGFSSFGGFGPGIGSFSNYQSYSSTGYLSGPGVIGGQFGYSSAYSGLGNGNFTGFGNRPYYGAYGYGFPSNGSTDGFPPFQRGNRFRRLR